MAGIEFDGVNNKIELNTGAAAADQHILFNGNAQDFYIGLDDSADDLLIGLGSTVGTTPIIAIDENKLSTFSGAITVGVDDTGHDVKLFGATAGSYALWDESADDLNLIASGLGIGTAKDLGVGIHIRTADSGATNFTDADDLVIEGSGVAGINIFTGTSSAGQINFGDSGANERGKLKYDHNGDVMSIHAESTEVIRFDATVISTGGETAADVTDGGICLDQGADDANIMTFKSSDIAHGGTSHAETDTYFEAVKHSATTGGAFLVGYTEDEVGLHLRGAYTNSETGKSGSDYGAVQIDARKKSGTSFTTPGTDDNLVVISGAGTTKFIFDQEGTMHGDSATTTFDTFEDAQLVRAFDQSLSTKGMIASKFDEFVKYNHEDLANAKLVGRDPDGSPNTMVNWTGIWQLHNGAIWQQYEKHERLANAMYELAKAAVGEEKANEILKENDIKLLN